MNDIFKNKKLVPALSLLCAVLWSLAFPFIKLGYREIGIAGDDLGSKILFAGIRFTVAGLVVLLLSMRKIKEHTKDLPVSVWGLLVAFALVNTSLHYLCSYIGLGYTPSGRGAIIDSTGSFILIILSCLIFSDDKMSVSKALGCILGFTGILILNINPGEAMFSNISFIGDGMIFLNALFGAFGSLLSRFVSKKVNMVFATGFSVAFGGLILLVIGLLIGPAAPWIINLKVIGIMAMLSLISSLSFTVFNNLVANNPISKVAIYNAFIPIFGVFLSSLILGEPFLIKYLIAGITVAAGIFIVNAKK